MERYFKVMSCKLVKWQVYLHGIFMAIQVMIPDAFFANIDKLILKFIWKFKKPSVAKTILKKEEQSWRIHTSWFQNLLQSSCNQDTQINEIKSLEINHYIYG